jgi:hypothetical protein
VLLQNADDLFVCETIALHSLVLSMGQSLLQNGLFQRGKVSLDDEIKVLRNQLAKKLTLHAQLRKMLDRFER